MHILTRRTCHQHAGHVLVTAGDDDHSIKPVAARSTFDLVRNEVAGLEGVGHGTGAVADAVAARDTLTAPVVPPSHTAAHTHLTPTVPNWYPMIPASPSDFLTCWPSPRRCLLHLEPGDSEPTARPRERGLTGCPRTYTELACHRGQERVRHSLRLTKHLPPRPSPCQNPRHSRRHPCRRASPGSRPGS